MTQRNTSGAQRSGAEADSGFHSDFSSPAQHAGFDGDSGPAERAGTSAGFGAGLGSESSGSRSGDDSTGTIERKRRRRGGRGRSRKAGDAAPSSSAEDSGGEAEPSTRSTREADPKREAGADTGEAGGPRKRSRRRGGRSKRSEETDSEGPQRRTEQRSTESGDSPADGESAEAKPRRKRRRKSGDSEPRGETGETGESAAEDDSGSRDEGDAEEGGQRKKIRRRRGTRGGRRSKSSSGSSRGPVAMEEIPGEDDELAPQGRGQGLPELPDETEEVEAGRGSKKRRRRSRKRRGEEEGDDESQARDEDEDDDEPRSTRGKKASATRSRAKPAATPNKILVNAGDREETRVSVVRDGQINDFQMTVKRHQSLVNDIYRGKVVNLEPAIGAAFIDFGQGRNGFLHTSDVLGAYGEKDWSLDKLLTTKVDLDEWDGDSQVVLDDDDEDVDDDAEAGEEGDDSPKGRGRRKKSKKKVKAKKVVRGRGRPRHRPRPRLPISDLLKKGQSVVVQVTKDAIGDKGPTLTTYISIPGRFLGLMPSMARTGVSRKIEDEKERRRLKRILEGLEIPSGMGVIVRTAGVGATKTDLKRDLDYLLLLWDSFGKRLNLGRGPAPLYEESDVAIRTIRDLFDEGTEAVIVDDQTVFERVQEFTEKLMPEKLDLIQLHDGPRPLFHHHGVEQDFEKIFAHRVDLPSGGSIVFDQTEALVAIDVNSGKTRTDGFDFEEIALKTNLDAVPEIARQIRLRDLGGIIVCDFIDMQKTSNRRAVERALRTEMSPDRARSKLGRISQFGLLELTRQRLGPGMSKMLFHNCPSCRGSGSVRTTESKTAAIVRRLGSALTLKGFSKVEVRAHPETLEYLKRNFSRELQDLEAKHERQLELVEAPDQLEDCVLRYLRADGREVRPGGRRKR